MIFFDTETCGLHGVAVTLQYAINNGEIEVYHLWKTKVGETLKFLRLVAEHKGGVVGFNLTFDWFHLQKIYNIFEELEKEYGPECIPEKYIYEAARLERKSMKGKCLKPVSALDLMLHARKGPYQSTLERSPIVIKKVPDVLAQPLANELHKRIPLNELYFKRRKKKLDNYWQVEDCKELDGTVKKGFKNIILRFSPSTALKALAIDLLKIPKEEVIKFVDVEVNPKLRPKELGWAPFAEALEEYPNYYHTWPAKLQYHIDHWYNNTMAIKYAKDDVHYTRLIYEAFDKPEMGDVDSILACAVGSNRFRGFKVSTQKMETLRTEAIKRQKSAPLAPSRVKKWLHPVMDPMEIAVTRNSTAKKHLTEISTWTTCEECSGTGCNLCKHLDDKGDRVTNEGMHHPAALRAIKVLDARKAGKERELYDKIIQAKRLHASFKVIGALSGRMSGADKLNPQGIKRTNEVRSCFDLADDDHVLCGGDFESFEVCIAVAVYKDPQLEKDLAEYDICVECVGKGVVKKTKKDEDGKPVKDDNGKDIKFEIVCPECNGSKESKRKIHGVFGSILYNKTYKEVVQSKGSKVLDMYTNGKSGLFSQLYGGNEHTLEERLSIEPEMALRAMQMWKRKYPGIAKAQKRIFDMFCSMRQDNGIGTKPVWNEPHEYIESLLGFKRYFTLENSICKVLYELAEKPPKEWTNLKVKVTRTDRTQTASGAVRSALIGAAFGIQGSNLRAAQNHEIQATGAGITKSVQSSLWELQPSGANDWKIQVFNVHDEIMSPCVPELVDTVREVVKNKVEEYRPLVPLIQIDWQDNMKSWSEK